MYMQENKTNGLHKVKKGTENRKRKILTVVYGINNTFFFVKGYLFIASRFITRSTCNFDPCHFLQIRHSAT
jgi:hypothetical protein